MLNQTINVTWKPAEFFEPAKKERRMAVINHRFDLFDPIRVMIADAFKSRKRKMFLEQGLTGCDIKLTGVPRDDAVVGYKILTADVFFDPNEFSEMSCDPTISGPYTVSVFEKAMPKLEKIGLLETDTIRQMVRKFENDGFRYCWILKDADLKKRDFRVKLEVSQYPALDCVWAEITSEQLGLSEKFEVFSQEKRFDLEPALVPASRGEFTSHGGMYNVRHVSLSSEGLIFGSNEMHCYSATFGRGQLSDKACDGLGIF